MRLDSFHHLDDVLPKQELQYAEEVYLEMKDLCEKGNLCIFQVSNLPLCAQVEYTMEARAEVALTCVAAQSSHANPCAVVL